MKHERNAKEVMAHEVRRPKGPIHKCRNHLRIFDAFDVEAMFSVPLPWKSIRANPKAVWQVVPLDLHYLSKVGRLLK